MARTVRMTIILCLTLGYILNMNAQISVKDALMGQGTWFLFSARTEEKVNERVFTRIDFFKKSDVSSIFFDEDDKLFSVFSKEGSDIWEDLWRMADDTHFVIVSPADQSTQIMDIIELNSKKLVIRNCSDTEGGSKCVIYTYFSTKNGWLPDREIEELNTAGVMVVDRMMYE